MKKFLYIAVAAIAALSSCSSDIDLLSGTAGNGGKVFTARFEGANSRATLNGMTPNWEAGDLISINGAEYKAKSAGASSEFEATGTEAQGETYNAYFPESLYNGGTPTLPSTITETYAADKFNMPMYATSSTTDLEFKNLCGVLAITVKSEHMAQVKSIKVSSSKQATSGPFTVTDNTAVLTNASAYANDVTVTYTDAVATDASGKTFYVAIPAQAYDDLTITVSDGTISRKMTTAATEAITVARNAMYEIPFNPIIEWSCGLDNYNNTIKHVIFEVNKDVSSYTVDEDHKMLDNDPKLWSVKDGETLKVQTSFSKIKRIQSTAWLFKEWTVLENVTGFEYVDMSDVTNMSLMFEQCYALTNLDLSSFNTEKVDDMGYMFSFCENLKILRLSEKFDMKNVKNVIGMFNDCYSLESLYASNNFHTNGVGDISYLEGMFSSCGQNVSGGGVIYGITDPSVKASLRRFEGEVDPYDPDHFEIYASTRMEYMKFDGE